MRNLTHRSKQAGHFPQKIRALFKFPKKYNGDLPPTLWLVALHISKTVLSRWSNVEINFYVQ